MLSKHSHFRWGYSSEVIFLLPNPAFWTNLKAIFKLHHNHESKVNFSSENKVSLVNHLVNNAAHVKNKWHPIFTSKNSNENFSKSVGISLVLYTHLSYGLSPAGDSSHVKSFVNLRIFSMSFYLWNYMQVTRPTWNHLWNS